MLLVGPRGASSAGWPEHPVVHEVFTWVWLADLERIAGRPMTLGRRARRRVGRRRRRRAIDAVWLMGVWQRSPLGAAIARVRTRAWSTAQRRPLPDVGTDADVVGSAYCIRDYVVDERLGGDAGWPSARRSLAASGRRPRPRLRAQPRGTRPPVGDEPPGVLRPRVTPTTSTATPQSFLDVDEPCSPAGATRTSPPGRRCSSSTRRAPRLRTAAAELVAATRRPLRRAALRHGDADARRRVPPHVGRPRVGRAGARRRSRLLADGDRSRAGDPPGLRVLGRGVLGPRAGPARAGLRCLLRQAAVRPPRATARRPPRCAPTSPPIPPCNDTRSGSSRTTTSRGRRPRSNPRPSCRPRDRLHAARVWRCSTRARPTDGSPGAGDAGTPTARTA